MSNQAQLQTIQFHNQSLVTFEQNGTYYTAMKPICGNIGLDWEAQRQRIRRDEVLSQGAVMITLPSVSGEQQTLCLPIQYLNGWLFGIDTNRVKPEIRETLIKYKKECYQALFDYWFKGKAERSQTTVDDRTGLRDAVNMLVSKKGLIYSDAYNLVHQYMNVKSIDEISKVDLPKAVEYVHRIVLEGELIEPKGKNVVEIPYDVADALVKFHRFVVANAKKTEKAFRAIHEAMGYERYIRNDLAADNFDIHNEFHHWISEFEEAVHQSHRLSILN